MKKNYIITIIVLLSLSISAQKSQIKKADKEFNKYAYMDAVKVYEKAVEKGYGSAPIFQKLGNAYYFNGQYAEANKWYAKLFAANEPIDSEYYYRYSQSLKSVGDNNTSLIYLQKFAELRGNDHRAKQFKDNKNYLEDIKNSTPRYMVDDAGINSEFSEYPGAFYQNSFVFTSSRKNEGTSNKIHSWTKQPFSDLYLAEVNADRNLANAKNFDQSINSKLNESTAVFTKDGKTVYFTRNNFINGKKGKSDDNAILLKLYKATNIDGKWSNVTELPFNSQEYNCAHPALSADEKTLYFVSDMPGTLGQSDIFKATINSDGSFGKPENLGNAINTEGRESFPFISETSELYFSSDGHLGLGGLDIFAVKIKTAGYSKVFNVGIPVNTEFDDFAFVMSTQTRTGYFASNRDGGKGYDDIYSFRENTELPFNCQQALSGKVTDAETKTSISKAVITLYDADQKVLETVESDPYGMYTFKNVACDGDFSIKVGADGFDPQEFHTKTNPQSGTTTLDFSLTRRFTKIESGKDLAKAFDIQNIYFDLDKWEITRQAEEKLALLLSVMELHPKLFVDVRSHTDSRASDAYNLQLSERRAKSTLDWLVKKGIAANRLTAKGMGETQLVNGCVNDSKCSEEAHQANRRSEFIIVSN